MLFISVGIPYFEPPFGGDAYFLWLPIIAVVLGLMGALRRERGPVARVGLIGGACAGGILVVPQLLVLIGDGILGLFGVD